MTVVVLGATGFLGSNLVRLLDARFEVVAVSRGAAPGASSAPFEGWTAAVDQALARGPVAVVNTVAIAVHAQCETDPVACDRVNHLLARDVGAACRERAVPLVHVSTDGLFGQGTPQTAPGYFGVGDATFARNAYARSKRAAEQALELLDWGHVLRLSFVGPDNGTRRGLVRFMADRARSGARDIDGYVDTWFTPVHVRDVARVISGRVERPVRGFELEHVASYPAMTKYDYLKAVLAGAGVDIEVVPVARDGAGALQPADQSLAAPDPVSKQSVIDASVRDVMDLLAE